MAPVIFWDTHATSLVDHLREFRTIDRLHSPNDEANRRHAHGAILLISDDFNASLALIGVGQEFEEWLDQRLLMIRDPIIGSADITRRR